MNEIDEKIIQKTRDLLILLGCAMGLLGNQDIKQTDKETYDWLIKKVDEVFYFDKNSS